MKRPKGWPKDLDIPTVFYHGTTLAKGKVILRDGLLPSKMERDDEDEGPFAFLSDAIGVAKAFAPGGEYSTVDTRGVILRIEPPEKMIEKFRFDLGEFIRCPVDIPPDYIEIEQYTNPEAFPK